MKNPSDRLLELDVLRGLAALSVLCFHYTTFYTKQFFPASPALFNFPLGKYGVQLFFMISGFVIFMSLERTKHPFDFVVSRFSRLYPAYWVAIIVTFTLANILPVYLPSGEAWREISAHQALINLSMLQRWFNTPDVDGVYWTLAAELSFYFLMFVLFVAGKLRFIEEIGLVWLVLMVGNYTFFWRVNIHVPQVVDRSQLLYFGHLFFAGILFYNLRTKGNAWHRHVALALCLLVQYLMRDFSPFNNVEPHITLFVAGYFLIFYLFVFNRLSWIVCRPLIFLGTISYSLYITHARIGDIIINHLDAVHASTWLRFFVPLGCALLIASAITYGVEKPVMHAIRQTYKNLRSRFTVPLSL